MNAELIEAIRLLEKERAIDAEVLFECLKVAGVVVVELLREPVVLEMKGFVGHGMGSGGKSLNG